MLYYHQNIDIKWNSKIYVLSLNLLRNFVRKSMKNHLLVLMG